MDTLKALEKCPGTPELCEYRVLNCKYILDTASLAFDFEDKISSSSNVIAVPEGMVTKEYDGKTWGRIFYQDSSTGQFFTNETEALSML